MAYVMVSADFQDVNSAQREAIYKCLEEKHWQKVTEFGWDITTIGYASFTEESTEDGVTRTAKNEFDVCSKPCFKPKLVIHYGENKPTFHGLN